MIFESADIQTMILLASKKDLANYTIDYRKIKTSQASFTDVINLLHQVNDDKNEIIAFDFKKVNWKDKTLNFSNNQVESILKNIQLKGNFFLDPKNEVATGIDVHQDFLSKASQQNLGLNYCVGEGIFNLSTQEKDSLNLSNQELRLLKPFYTTDELSRYYGNQSNKLWVIYTNSEFKDVSAMSTYPNLKRHLDRFESVITSDNKPYGLHRARNEDFFKGEKIISLRKCKSPTFTYADFDCYVSQTFFVIKTNRINQKYLTAILNSSVVTFWLRHKGKMQGDLFQVDKAPILEIPIPTAGEGDRAAIGRLVSYVLYLTEQLKDVPTIGKGLEQASADKVMTQYFEKIIDALVYELYLTEELHAKNKYFMRYLLAENLPDLEIIEGNKIVTLRQIFQKLFHKDYPIAKNLFFLDSVEEIRIIEGKK
jgi:adenine-specific DNA-methyltransferase